ncbi:hypothetical protein ACI1US_02297 [Leucobacter sp. BZR 635]
MTTDAHTQQLTGGVAQIDPATAAPSAAAAPAPHSAYVTPPEASQYPAQHTAETQNLASHSAEAQYSDAQYAVPGQQYQLSQPAPGKNAHGYTIASFVIGIASIVSGWTFVAPIVGLVLGVLALRRNTPERTLALWGVWLNGVILAIAVLGVLLLIALASFGLLAGAFAGIVP